MEEGEDEEEEEEGRRMTSFSLLNDTYELVGRWVGERETLFG